MSAEFLVPTGYIVKDYMEYFNLNQKEFALRLGVSEKHVSNFLNGKTRLSDELALKLEKVLTQVNASYWLNYEAKYREYVARINEIENMYTIDQLQNYSKRFMFSEVFKSMNLSLKEQAFEMLKILGIADFNQFDKVYNHLNIDFKEDGGSLESIIVWLNLSKENILIQNEVQNMNDFNKERLISNLDKLKRISLNDNYLDSIQSARKLLNSLGIYLVLTDPIKNSKVRGALSYYSKNPVIYLSGRFKTHDHVWFALLHEIGHLILHFDKKVIISLEDDNFKNVKEIEADKFASNFFVNEKDYHKFIKSTISENAIIEFAYTQDVHPGIVVSRLQHDGILKYNQFNNFKSKG